MSFWRREFSEEDIDFLLDQIRGNRFLNDEGKIFIEYFGDYDGWISILVSALGLKMRTDALKTEVVRAALFSPDLPIDFTEKDFRKTVYRLHQRHEGEGTKSFRVVFPIWNPPGFLKGIRRMGEVTLNFSPSPRSRLFNAIIEERERQYNDPVFSSFFTGEKIRDLRRCSICIAHVRAYHAQDANERASEALYKILGLVNLVIDVGKSWRLSMRVAGKLPVSDVLIGPHTTTHFNDGKLTHNGFWHESWVGGPEPKTQSAKTIEARDKRVRHLMDRLSHSRWRHECESAVVMYFKAFSNPNLGESFLEGWRLFENISGGRYEKVSDQIQRASNIFQQNTEYSLIAKHLALRRNLLTHGYAIKADDEETLAFQMLNFVAPFLERFIQNGFDFSSLVEFWEFLDLPAQRSDREILRDELSRKLGLLDNAATFRGEAKY